MEAEGENDGDREAVLESPGVRMDKHAAEDHAGDLYDRTACYRGNDSNSTQGVLVIQFPTVLRLHRDIEVIIT